jgi:hypothetical protein
MLTIGDSLEEYPWRRDTSLNLREELLSAVTLRMMGVPLTRISSGSSTARVSGVSR